MDTRADAFYLLLLRFTGIGSNLYNACVTSSFWSCNQMVPFYWMPREAPPRPPSPATWKKKNEHIRGMYFLFSLWGGVICINIIITFDFRGRVKLRPCIDSFFVDLLWAVPDSYPQCICYRSFIVISMFCRRSGFFFVFAQGRPKFFLFFFSFCVTRWTCVGRTLL